MTEEPNGKVTKYQVDESLKYYVHDSLSLVILRLVVLVGMAALLLWYWLPTPFQLAHNRSTGMLALIQSLFILWTVYDLFGTWKRRSQSKHE